MSERNILDNIVSIELGKMTLDENGPLTVMTIRTKKNNYVYRLSESFPVEKQVEIFKAMVMDLQTDDTPVQAKLEEPVVEVEQPTAEPAEKHDGKPLFDVPPSDVDVEIKPVEGTTQE